MNPSLGLLSVNLSLNDGPRASFETRRCFVQNLRSAFELRDVVLCRRRRNQTSGTFPL